MASVSDPCDAVNANPTASQDKPGQMPAIYQGLAICLKDPDKKYEDKVCAVLATWERLASSSLTDNIQCLIECLFSDTLRLILRGEWPKLQPAVKTHLSVVLKQTSASLGNAEALALCRIVSRLVQNPWEDSTLSKILVGKELVDDDEAEKFCVSETPSLLVMRLEMLCDSKCEDLALRLLKVCLRCMRRENGQFLHSCTKQNLEFFADLNVALLYRNKYRSEIISHLQQLSSEEEHQLVERFLVKRVTDHSCRIWRSSLKIAQFVSGYCLARALVKLPPPATLAVLTTHWLTAQKQLGVSSHDLVEMLKKLVAHSETSAHMYTVCTVLREEKDPDLKALCIELYVRAAVVDVNDLERRKLKGDSEGVRSTELTLADTFSALADLVSSNVTICRECVLTAFSLQPTRQRFEKLQNLAKASHERKVFRNQDSPSPSIEHPPAGSGGGPGDSAASSLTFHLKDVKRKESFEDADSGVDINDVATGINDLEDNITSSPSPYTAEAAVSLGVSKQIMNDLAVVLHSPRWEVLNWGVGWSELRPLCERYLENQERMRSVTKELKYLNIDYSQFEHMPKVERGQFDGIEKGYETFVQQWSSEDELEPTIPPLQENVERPVRQPKKKVPRAAPTERLSADSDSSACRLGGRRKLGRPKKYADFESDLEVKRKQSADQVKALRMFRPTPASTRPDDSSKSSSSFPVRISQSNNTHAASPCNVGNSDYFAPLLSTLNMNPKIVLTRTPVNSPSSSPLKTVHKPKERTKGSPMKDLAPNRKGSLEMAGKLDLLNHGNIQRTLANLKGLDMVQVRRGPTAVHMVELPDPPTSHITSNGISNNGPSSSGNSQNQQQPEQHQEKPPPPSSVEGSRPDLLAAPKLEEDQAETVTLMSTPSVTIFEVAHRPHTSSTVLQPISAITGVSSSNARARMPLVSANPFSGLRPTGPRISRAAIAEGTTEGNSSSQALAQLLSQPLLAAPTSSPSVPTTLGQNGSQSVASYRGQQQPSTSYRNMEPSRTARPPRREQQPAAQQQEGSNSSSAGDLACRVPLVKYVDLDMVSSPSRIRQNNIGAHRRSSQGSNSSSPDPHHSRNAAKGRGGSSSQNPPTSPSLASPVSPALQPPLSPMASRKPYAYRQDGKSYLPSSADGLLKMGADLKQPSPSHPSQCSSPFSRPSSRSQDASSSPSDLISSIYPSSMVYSASEALPAAASRMGYGAASFNNLPALPKFQQAFGRKTNFSALPTLADNVVPEVSHLPDPQQQQQQQQQQRSFIDRRFSEQQNSPAEEEGLGSKLQSLLESALNGHIGRSPSRHPSGHSQLLQSADLLLPAGLTDSPFGQVSNDSALLSNLEPNSSTLEQLREFESIFERVASTSQLKEQHPWTDLGQADDTSFLPSGVEYLVPSAGYSTSLDTVSSSVEDTLRSDSGLEAEGPLIHLLNVASAARQALEEEENKSNGSTQPDETGQDQVDAKIELVESPQDSQQPTLTVNTLQEHSAQPLVTSPIPTAAAVVSETTKPPPATTTPPSTCSTAVKTETASPTKSNRSKQGVKSSPAVSPGSSGVNASKGSSSSAAPPKAPQKAHDDEQTVLRVNAILEEYREQLRNSPDLQNKPAPRRRSNPLPSPTATPKRRKSSQSKVKLLSQHARPLDATAAPSESSAASAGAASESSPGSDQHSEAVLPEVKTEVAATSTTATSETVAILTGVAKSTPFKIAAQQAAETVAPQSNNVTSTVTNASISLPSAPNMPIAVQQVLVTSQAGVRQVLLPVSIAGPFRQALVRGTSQRFVTVRPVTVSGASGFISLPARLPLTVRTISAPLSADGAFSSAVAAAAHVVTSGAVTVACSSSAVAVTKATDTRVSIQDLLTTQVTELIQQQQQQQQQQPQPNVQRPISSTTSTVHWAPSAAQLELSSQKSDGPKAESTVLRFVPTVNRVSLPLFESTSLLTVENRPAPNEVITETLDEQEWTAKDQNSPKNAESEASVASTAAVIVPDDKLLIEDGVSEFLPCADFTGPGVSPSPCFAFTDSPLGSQNSSRAASPTALLVPSVEGEVAACQAMDSPADETTATGQAKLVKRTDKPKWVMLRNDHGGAEYRRVNDAGQCISQSSKDGAKKSGNRRSSKKAQHSVSESQPRISGADIGDTPLDPLHITEAEAAELERLNASANNSPDSIAADVLIAPSLALEIGGPHITGIAEDPLQLDETVALEETSLSPCEQHGETDKTDVSTVKEDGAQTETAAATAAGVQSASSPNAGSGVSGRRLSNRGHVKKNCPCCTGDPDTRKRSRSESSAGESSPAVAECAISAKRPSSAKSDTTKSPKAKKTAQQQQPRKR